MANHIIYKQTATIQIAAQQQASKIHEEVSDVLRYELPALLEPLFDELAGDEQIIRIDALNIDLKEIAQSNFKSAFKQKLLEEIEKALSETAVPGASGANVTIIPGQQSSLDAFIYFLRYGLKPWYISAKTMKAWAAQLSVTFTISHWQRLAAFIKTNSNPVVTERLIQQCPEAILSPLIETLSTLDKAAWKQVFADLLALYNLFTGKSGAGTSTLVWQKSFVAFTKDIPPSEALYNMVQEAYSQRQITIDITQPAELQQLQTLLHSPIMQQTILRVAGDVKQQAAVEVTASQKSAIKKDNLPSETAGIDVDTNETAGGEVNATAETGEDSKAKDVIDDTGAIEKKASFETKGVEEKEGIQNEKPLNDAEENLRAPGSWALEKNDTTEDNEHNRPEDAAAKNSKQQTGVNEVEKGEETQQPLQPQTKKNINKPSVAENEAQYVNNCGVIILHPFLKPYFDELGLLKEKEFVDAAACKRAVLLLHFLASGETEIAEFDLLLQKLLCGLPLEETLPGRFEMSEIEKDESEKLLHTVINYWPPLKNTSLAGLRATFLQREGKLEKKESGWLLRVEQKTVDILLDKLPWGFSTIRLPWMDDMISVEWC